MADNKHSQEAIDTFRAEVELPWGEWREDNTKLRREYYFHDTFRMLGGTSTDDTFNCLGWAVGLPEILPEHFRNAYEFARELDRFPRKEGKDDIIRTGEMLEEDYGIFVDWPEEPDHSDNDDNDDEDRDDEEYEDRDTEYEDELKEAVQSAFDSWHDPQSAAFATLRELGFVNPGFVRGIEGEAEDYEKDILADGFEPVADQDAENIMAGNTQLPDDETLLFFCRHEQDFHVLRFHPKYGLWSQKPGLGAPTITHNGKLTGDLIEDPRTLLNDKEWKWKDTIGFLKIKRSVIEDYAQRKALELGILFGPGRPESDSTPRRQRTTIKHALGEE